MTRTEFNRRFAVAEENTEGYTEAQLEALNEVVFQAVEDVDLDDRTAESVVDDAFARLCCHYSVLMA